MPSNVLLSFLSQKQALKKQIKQQKGNHKFKLSLKIGN